MKRVFAALLALTLVSQVYLHSKGDDYEPLIVLIVIESTKPSSSTNRAPALCPVDGRYNTLTNLVELSFKSNLGTVDVTIENLTTGEIGYRSCDSSLGSTMFPVSSDSCYALTITTESGRVFTSSFQTVSLEDESIN